MDLEAFQVLQQELGRLRQRAPEPGEEPQFRYLLDPPGKYLALAYATQYPATSEQMPIFVATIPPLTYHRDGYLSRALLAQTGLKGWNQSDAATRLVLFLQEKQTELLIFLDCQFLLDPQGLPLTNEIHWLISLSKTQTRAHFLAVGSPEMKKALWIVEPDRNMLYADGAFILAQHLANCQST